ncbi:MAG: ArnT family glycosyltransferase, partial [Candidatus Binataceae bacterium]
MGDGAPARNITFDSRLAGRCGQAIVALGLCGLAIRLYLSLTNYCISGDGAAYLAMAGEYDRGDWKKPLGAVFSPLYPLLIAGLHRLIPDWELAGNLVSAFLGTGAIVSVYLLTREVFRRRDLALGAAALTAIHPDLAAYAASVRTEAGYIFVTTTAVWLILKARRENRVTMAALAGAIAGVAYLYR